ncbi:MAG: type II secretion system protein GspH [Methylococcales bacterium]|nr:MAG: type II secretion system protein GspH [Methylococcales bacterium]
MHSLSGGVDNKTKGFTLLELMIVLFIMVLGFSVVGINLSSGNDATALKAASRDIASALRFARGEALISHQEMTVNFNLIQNTYTVSRRDKIYAISKSIGVTLVTAKRELTEEGMGRVRFFPDGSSTGGRITLKKNKLTWQLDINWLTGQVELNDKDSSE